MTVTDLLDKYLQANAITEYDIEQIRSDSELRSGLCKYFIASRNRLFSIDLLNTFIEVRKDPAKEINIEDLMLGCYILGLHQQIEDCLLVWKVKNVDFDSYCGVDIQLVAFAGVEPTISYLQTINSEEAKAALEYIHTCSNSGDFDNLDEYFSPNNLPWWI